MDNSKNNSVNISGKISDSNVVINQNQDGQQTNQINSIEYVVDENSYKTISSDSIQKSNKLFSLTIAISALSVIADITGILSFSTYRLPPGLTLLIATPICIYIALKTKPDRILSKIPADDKSYFKMGKWYEKLNNGDVASYSKFGKCIYPNCDGIISVVPAPPKEQENHSLAGICSVGGIQHTYTVDFNGYGEPHKFDWGTPPKQNNT